MYLARDVRQKLDQFVYPAPLILVVLFGWTSLGLSMLTQPQTRMTSPSWTFHNSLTQWLPVAPHVTWGLAWLAGTALVAWGLTKSLRALRLALYASAGVPLLWVGLFITAAVHDPRAGVTGVTTYAVMALLAIVTGKGLQGVQSL